MLIEGINWVYVPGTTLLASHLDGLCLLWLLQVMYSDCLSRLQAFIIAQILPPYILTTSFCNKTVCNLSPVHGARLTMQMLSNIRQKQSLSFSQQPCDSSVRVWTASIDSTYSFTAANSQTCG